MKKTLGAKVFKDGKWYWWCDHHKWDGFYDGLYVTHSPENHDEWKAKQDANKKRKQARNQPTGGSSSFSGSGSTKSEGKTKLVLDDRLKQALLTEHGFSDLQLEQLTGSLKK